MLKKLLILAIFMQLLQGSTVHKFQKAKSLDGGYGVARFGYIIPEYTVDMDKKAPKDLKLAKQRYSRRKWIVENYYIQMGKIDTYFRRYVWRYPTMISSLTANVFKTPFNVASEYKYDHNEAYRQKIDKADALQKAKEDARNKMIMEQLYDFIRQDLQKEAQNPR